MKRILGLQRRLLDRSVEAYIQSLETINRLSLVYRVETFAWLICNAWELMLKARIIQVKGDTRAIFYSRKRGEQIRSYSLGDCINVVLPNESDPVRRNLLLIEDLRHQATHLVIRQVPTDVIGLFQACVVNYHNRLYEWFGWSLSKRVSVGMMAIVYDVGPEQFDLSNRVLRRQLGKDTAAYLTQFQARVKNEIDALGHSTEFCIGIGYKLALTQKPGEADIVLAKGDVGEATRIVEVPKDPSSSHPYLRSDLVKRVNELLGGSTCINGYDIQCIVANYGIAKRSELYYRGRLRNSQIQYSERFAMWIVQQHDRDPDFFIKQRDKGKQVKQQPATNNSIRSQPEVTADVQPAETLADVTLTQPQKLASADATS